MRFPVLIRRLESGLVRVTAAGKPDLRVAVPPELHGRHEGLWSPEDLLAASVASCWAVTFDAVAAHRGIPIHDVETRAAAVVDRVEGRFRVTGVELSATIETEPGRVEDARRAGERAEAACLISGALAVPVSVRLDVGVSPARRGAPGRARSGRARRESGASASA